MTRTRLTTRRPCRRRLHRHWRSLTRLHARTLPGFERAPDYLQQAIGAFRRAIRARRRLARLAPSIFDSAVVDRERQHREKQRRWLASWQPLLKKVYGPASTAERQVDQAADRPPELHLRTRRAVERELANWNFWFPAASLALERQRQRRPHALISLSQIASLLDIAFTLKRLACGLDSAPPMPEPLWDDNQWQIDLQRAYGSRPHSRQGPTSPHLSEPTPTTDEELPSAEK